jgi:signal transduction histidine kinase
MTQRIEVDSKWDDLSYLAVVLNEFLSRNEKLLKGIKQVSDNVAHDLRTPLTRLHNNLEAMRKAVPDDQPIALQCDELLQESDHLLKTFAALLRIAHVETGRQRCQFKPVDARALIADVIELYEPLAEEKHISLGYKSDAMRFMGDRDLLFQAIANLIDNAIKFTPAQGQIIVEAKTVGPAIHISVRDNGQGIADADKPRVFDRFYRANASRNTEGNGLGLALVGAVVELHRGQVTLEDAQPGLVITMMLPA